jgi:predicted metal-dependent peptidase
MLTPVEVTNQADYDFLSRELDRTKSAAFMGKNAAFLGSLLCGMDFQWTYNVPTAATDGETLFWNPKFFQELSVDTRQTVLMHELWHPGRLHFIRQGHRDPKLWNYATDIRINNDLKAEGYSFDGLDGCWMDPQYPPGMPEEDIYDDLVKRGIKPPPSFPFFLGPPGIGQEDLGDLLPGPGDKDAISRIINRVVRAVQQAKLSGAGDIPGDIEQVISRFLKPIVPWEQVLRNFMSDLVVESYSWQRPNRRYPDMYLPSRYEDEGRLAKLNYYEDVSGSISDEDAIRFNSEFKYVKETFGPEEMTLVQFDTRITQELKYKASDPFDQVKIIGRGGTSLVPVREHIIKHKPTAAVIFSDMYCKPMEDLPFRIPIIWVCIANQTATVPFGQLIHIRG